MIYSIISSLLLRRFLIKLIDKAFKLILWVLLLLTNAALYAWARKDILMQISSLTVDPVFVTEMEVSSKMLIDVCTVEACPRARQTGGRVLQETVKVIALHKPFKDLFSWRKGFLNLWDRITLSLERLFRNVDFHLRVNTLPILLFEVLGYFSIGLNPTFFQDFSTFSRAW